MQALIGVKGLLVSIAFPMSNASTAPIFPESQGPAQYEFTEAENVVFRALAREMRMVGSAYLGAGALLVLGAAVVLWAWHNALPISLVLVCISALGILGGQWLRTTSLSLARIADTRGSDISHLMSGMSSLHRLFFIQRTLLLFVAVMGVLGAAGAVLFILYAPVRP